MLLTKGEDCPRDADGHKHSPYEIFHLLKIEFNHSYIKKLGLGGNSILQRESVCKRRRNKLISNRQQSKEQIHQKFKAKKTSASKRVV